MTTANSSWQNGGFSTNFKNYISQQELSDNNIGLTKHFIGTTERGEANPTLEKFVYLGKSLNLKTINILNIEINIDKFIKENKR